MIYWILYGALAINQGNTTHIQIPEPLLFNNELQCLKVKELNEKELINKYDKINLACKKTELTK